MISIFTVEDTTYLPIICIIQTLVSQVVLSTRILSLYLSAVLRRLLLLVVRLLLVMMLLHLLNIFALLVLLSRVCNILHLASIVVVELLEILLTWAYHHVWILTATT